MLFKLLFDVGRLLYNHLKFLLRDGLQNARFNGFDAVQARLVGSETFDGRNAVALKEKLRRDFFAVVVHPGTQATFFNEVHCFGNFPFLQQDGSRRSFHLFEKRGEDVPRDSIFCFLLHCAVSFLDLRIAIWLFAE